MNRKYYFRRRWKIDKIAELDYKAGIWIRQITTTTKPHTKLLNSFGIINPYFRNHHSIRRVID